MTSLPRSRSLFRTAALGGVLAAAALGGCAPTNSFPPACPSLSLLPDAADLTSYSPRGQDLTDLILDGRIVTVPATCKRGDKGFVTTTMSVAADLFRGPSAPDRDFAVPVFIAVLDGDTVIDKQDYEMTGTFPANVDRMRMSTPEITLNLPVTPTKTAASYKIYIGFILTQDQLALNRKRGPR